MASATISLYLSLSCTVCRICAVIRLSQLLLSIHVVFLLPGCLFPSIFPSRAICSRLYLLLFLATCPRYLHFLSTIVFNNSWSVCMSFRTWVLVILSIQAILSIRMYSHISKAWSFLIVLFWWEYNTYEKVAGHTNRWNRSYHQAARLWQPAGFA